MRKIILLVIFSSFFSNYFSQITTSVNPTIAQMQALLQGNGVTVSSLSITCPAGAYATFGNGAGALGGTLNSGILLTTGSASNVAGPPTGFASTDNASSGGGGSALGNTLSGGTTYDGCYITFLITPSCATLSINYVFASEEYPEYATGSINDVFGFVLSGPNPLGGNYNQTNTATLPVTTTTTNVVSIQNVNNGSANAGPCVNCAYYVADPPGLIYDGKTTVLTASASVTPCQTYTMTIGVWDDSDGVFDSGVFLDVNGLSCANQPSLTATASPTSICGPQTITLTAMPTSTNATSSYTWSSPASGGLSATSGSVVTANPTAATTYTVKYSDMNTCPGFPVTQTVSVAFTAPPALPVNQTPAGSICAGQSVTLTANGGAGTYSWSPGTALSTTTNSLTVSSPTTTTTYTVTKTVGACVSSTVITVSVGGTSVTITPSLSTICAGQNQVLTASGGGPFVWTASTGANPSPTGTVTVNPTTTTTYTVLSGTGSCTASAVATVSAIAAPTVVVTPTLSTICIGQVVTLNATGGGPFVWTASSGSNPPNSGTIVVSPIVSTTYTVVLGTGSCTTSAVATVSISTTPSVNITPSSTVICTGQSVTLSSSGAAPFVWTASSGANPPSTANVTVTPTSNTTYTVLSGSGTCTATAVASVSISVPAAISITPSNTTICLGDNVALTSTGTGPFSWTASSGTNPASAANVTVTPTSTTTYTVVSGAGTCTTSAIATVSIGITPPIAITPSSTIICLGETLNLSSSGTGPFVWTASSGANPASAASVTVAPTTNTSYTVLAGTGACTVTAVATVSIAPTLTIAITPASTIICNGGSTILAVNGSAGPFVWTASTGATPAPSGTVTVNPLTTTTYTVLAGTGACTATAVSNVSVSPTLTLTITPSNTTICNGLTATLTTAGATSYTWSNGANTTSITATPSITTSYTVVGTDGICTNSTTATVNVVTPTISATSNFTYYCFGVAPVSLTGSGATTYTWSGLGLSSTSGAVVTATPNATTIYTVVGETSGCISTETISLTVPPISTLTAMSSNSIICIGAAGSTLTASGATTYTWSPGLLSNDTITVNPITTTQYTVAGQTSAGCFAVPAVVTVSVLPNINPVLTISSPTVCLTKTVSISAPASPGLTYTWQPTTAILGSNTTSSIVAIPASSSTVIYTVTISNGVCAGTNTIQLQVKTAPTITDFITLNNDTICTGGCVTFSASSTGSQPIFYQWYYESGVGTSSVGIAPEACYPSAGNYSVAATASNTCGFDTLVKTNFVTVFDMPVLVVGGDTTINIGESAEIFASGGLTYYWSPNVNGNTITCVTCSNTVVQPTLTTQYIVVASNSKYCKVQDTVTVSVDINCGDFFIPNVFSPNDDGLNDVINVHGRCISTFNLQIFNRWGEKVFETSTLENSWDGTFRGKKMDTGVFVYKTDGVSIDGQSFKMQGNITLIR